MTQRIAASAGRVALTLDQLISQSNALRGEAVAAGEDLHELRAAYRAYLAAANWLNRNRNSNDGSEVSRRQQLRESSKEGWRKWKKLKKLDGNVRAKSKQEAPARVFVMLIEMFSEFEKEDMTYKEFDEAMSDDHLGEVLLQRLEDKACYYDTSMKVLGEMLSNWQTFWHFIWLKEDFRNVKSVAELKMSLEAKLHSAFVKLVTECKKRDVIETDGVRYVHGRNWTDFTGEAFIFSERMLLIDLDRGVLESDEAEAPRLEDVFAKLCNQHELEKSLSDLSKMGVIEQRGDFVFPGPNFEVDNDPWLTYQFLEDLVVDAADAVPTMAVQCDSCKRRPFDSQDGPYALMLQTVNSRDIRRQARFKFPHIRSYSGRRARTYCLCRACKNYLVEGEDDEKNVWPLFTYHLLFGAHEPKFGDAAHHHSVCGGETLWRLVPKTMRRWWLDEIATLPEYSGCTLDSPPSVFEDKTLALGEFNCCFKSENWPI